MPQRNYSREHADVAKPNKRAILPIGLEEYQELSRDGVRFRAWLDSHPCAGRTTVNENMLYLHRMVGAKVATTLVL